VNRLTVAMIGVVLLVWLVGTWITKYSLGEMAILTPIAVIALGAFLGIVLLWVKVVRESLRRRREPGQDSA
jgi:hypothetical protein